MGTRFLPATKSIPKEMLPVVDKPLIHYAVEEALEAGIDTLIFIINRQKGAIREYFDRDEELESRLQAAGKHELHRRINDIIPSHVSAVYVIQDEPLGLGHAVWCAREVVGDEPFAVLLADDLIQSPAAGCLRQMVDEYEAGGYFSIGVEQIPRSSTGSYGIVSVLPRADGRRHIHAIVEKPAPEDAPSDLGVVGRYVLPGETFEMLGSLREGAGGEIQLTDAIAGLLDRHVLLAHAFDGERFDCGSRHGFIQATLAYALRDARLRASLLKYFGEQ